MSSINNNGPFICKCGVDLSMDLCACGEEESRNQEDNSPTFSPDVLALAMDLQKKIDHLKSQYADVTVLNMKADVNFHLGSENALKIFGETDPKVLCSIGLIANKK
jgi:hypothetical protein